jgi:hypothetical protein
MEMPAHPQLRARAQLLERLERLCDAVGEAAAFLLEMIQTVGNVTEQFWLVGVSILLDAALGIRDRAFHRVHSGPQIHQHDRQKFQVVLSIVIHWCGRIEVSQVLLQAQLPAISR